MEEYLINSYTENDLKTKDEVEIYSNIDDSDLKYITLMKDNSKIKITSVRDNEKEFIEDILRILENCNKLNKKIIISFEISNRKNLYNYISKLRKYTDKNIVFKCELEKYTLSEYLEENDKLEQLVKKIKERDMSTLEKYIAVYNIVKKFKPYNENENDLMKAREIKYILNNEYIVCVGYSLLLSELLNRVGIESCIYKTTTSKYDNKANLEESEQHFRTIVNIKDEKYGIDGYFISDATWDNHKNIDDTYNYALRPFNSMQKSEELFRLNDLDYILDNSNFNNFCLKVNILLNKKINEGRDLISAYESVFIMIIDLLEKLDKSEYRKLKKYTDIDEYNRNEKFYKDFLTEIGHYIVNKNNKEIKPEILAQAIVVAKFYNENIPNAFKEAYKDKIIKEYGDYTYEITDEDIFNQNLNDNDRKGRHI